MGACSWQEKAEGGTGDRNTQARVPQQGVKDAAETHTEEIEGMAGDVTENKIRKCQVKAQDR